MEHLQRRQPRELTPFDYSGTSWESHTLYSSSVQSLDVAADPAGNAFAVIYDGNIKAKRYDVSGGAWSDVAIVSAASSSVEAPQIAFDAAGNAMAVWVQDGTAYVSRLAAGAWPSWTLGSALDEASAAKGPQVAMDARGNGIIAWINHGYLRIKRYRAWVNWDTWVSYTAYLTEILDGNVSRPSVSIDPSGKAIVVWQDCGVINAVIFQ